MTASKCFSSSFQATVLLCIKKSLIRRVLAGHIWFRNGTRVGYLQVLQVSRSSPGAMLASIPGGGHIGPKNPIHLFRSARRSKKWVICDPSPIHDRRMAPVLSGNNRARRARIGDPPIPCTFSQYVLDSGHNFGVSSSYFGSAR